MPSTSCGDSTRPARYETVVLDPPAFAKNKAALDKALAGYKEINLRALRLLEPGGTLVTCTCGTTWTTACSPPSCTRRPSMPAAR